MDIATAQPSLSIGRKVIVSETRSSPLFFYSSFTLFLPFFIFFAYVRLSVFAAFVILSVCLQLGDILIWTGALDAPKDCHNSSSSKQFQGPLQSE